jgi:4'-phosphopantetheinyl transferase
LEREALRAAPPSYQRRLFIELWTLKEAYLKARGIGLSVSLDQLSFASADGMIRMSSAGGVSEAGEQWQFRLVLPTERHVLAVALRRTGAAPFRLLLRAPEASPVCNRPVSPAYASRP